MIISFILKIKHCHPTNSDEFAHPGVPFPLAHWQGQMPRQTKTLINHPGDYTGGSSPGVMFLVNDILRLTCSSGEK